MGITLGITALATCKLSVMPAVNDIPGYPFFPPLTGSIIYEASTALY